MKLLFRYLKPFRSFILLTLLIKTAGTLIELAIPYILSHILDVAVPNGVVPVILFWGVAMILCALLALLGNITANRMAAKVARNVTEKLRHALFTRTMSLSGRQIDRFTVPSLESRLTSDTYHVHHFIGMSMRMGVRAPILLIGGLAVTAVLDHRLTLIMAAVLPFIGVSMWWITKKGIPLFRQSQQSVDRMIRIVREDAGGIRVIKALSKTDYERRKYDEANRRLVADEQKASATMALSNPLVTLFLNLGLVCVILLGAFLVNEDRSSPGKIIAFIQYFTMISMATISLSRIFVNYSKGAASAKRIEEVITTEEDLTLRSEEELPPKQGEEHIVFEHVSFSYLGHKDNLSDLSFSVPKGGTLGIIGATGSGKTTLLALLMRLYDTDCGSIRIDGRDVRTIPREELSSRFGAVMQNDFLYTESIAENIRFGRPLTEEAVQRAARLAMAEEFITAYDDGYDHLLVAKGANLSGGQKQRLLIARALAGDPDILILDDASSALDYKTDAALRRNLREQMKNSTTLIVAQRVSSVMYADRILVLDEGRIIGSGTHEELLRSCSVYHEISRSQIGGAILE
ncbi:MAG: ABC transporter ATP-binding protein [Clostridia bacterium]|nr:ABC transporter ATP-binding protein [Clostridia bacterium]